MREYDTDVAIIGAGSAGLSAIDKVRAAERRWMLIEAGPTGTTCARVGCMPSKLLIAAAERAAGVASADTFGIEVASYKIDAHAVFARVRAERDRFVAGVRENLDDLPAENKLRGHARFEGETALRVGDDARVRARAVILATGSTPVVPAPFDAIRDSILTSDDIFELERLPSSLAVIGTGTIGLELGQAMQKLGVEVSFFSHENYVGIATDPKLQSCAREVLNGEHRLELCVDITAAEANDDGIQIHWKREDGERLSATFEQVLVAAGRKPRLDGLDLDAAGLKVSDQGGIEGWSATSCRCGKTAVFAAGDVTDHIPLLHEAVDEGHIAGRNASSYPAINPGSRRVPLSIAFSDPQMAIAGASYDSLDRADIETGAASFADQGRARILAANRGLLHVYARRGGGRLLGAELFGPQIEHISHLLAWAIQQRLTVFDLLRMPFYHPVLEEALRTALEDLREALK